MQEISEKLIDIILKKCKKTRTLRVCWKLKKIMIVRDFENDINMTHVGNGVILER